MFMSAIVRIFSFGERWNVLFNSAIASLNGTFHLSPHENILTIVLINIHYLYNIHVQFPIWFWMLLSSATHSKLKFAPLFLSLRFFTFVCFKTSDVKTTIDPDKICVKIFPGLQTSCPETSVTSFKPDANPGLSYNGLLNNLPFVDAWECELEIL